MEKIIWVIDDNKRDLISMQRKINVLGGICSMSIVSAAALQKIIEERLLREDVLSYPSLILISYHMVETDKAILDMLKSQPKLAGVPLFFMVHNGEDTDKEDYYSQGAMIVLEKPVNQNGILRIRQAAEQYEMTRSYERIFQKQASELAVAKKIQSLNVQLENRNKFLCRVFGKYFSDDVLEVILADSEEFPIGDRSQVAVLMCDLRGFSAKSEELKPDELMLILNRFFGAMVEVIAGYNGTVIEFMGDAILAIFGAPMPNEQYVESAVAAAISMQNAMKEINVFGKERGIFELEMGVGVHCGEAFVGNVGTEKMMRYNVIGRVVNECSRIESCSIGGQVLVSKNILNQLSCDVTIENRLSVEAKGIRHPLQIYEVSGIGGEYQCSLEKAEEILYLLAENIGLDLYLIKDKMLSTIPVETVLKSINTHSGIVELAEELIWELPVYSDVEVRTKCGVDTQFSGVYAKVIQINGKEVRLRFTHLNKEFEEFIKRLNLEKGIAYDNI